MAVVANGFSLSPFGHSSMSTLVPTTSKTTMTMATRRRDTILSMASVAEDKVYTPEPVDGYPKRSGASSYSDEEYVFISVEEAEQAMRRERMQYERDHEEMRRLIAEQRHQLDELTNRAAQHKQNRGEQSPTQPRIRVTHVVGGGSSTPSMSASSSAPMRDSFSTHRHNEEHHQRQHRDHYRHSSSQKQPFVQSDAAFSTGDSYSDDATPLSWNTRYHQAQLIDLEHRLHEAMQENAVLMQRLRDQRHMYDEEKEELERRVLEERERVLCLQEELSMERAYFEQSKNMLEDLLTTEQKKVQNLQEDLMIREMQDQQRMFQNHQQTYQAHSGGNTRTQYSSSGTGSSSSTIHSGVGVDINSRNNHQYNGQKGGGRSRSIDGLEMNDIRSPLYP